MDGYNFGSLPNRKNCCFTLWPHWFIRRVPSVSCFLSPWGHRVMDHGLGSICPCICFIYIPWPKCCLFPFNSYLLPVWFFFAVYAVEVEKSSNKIASLYFKSLCCCCCCCFKFHSDRDGLARTFDLPFFSFIWYRFKMQMMIVWWCK